MRVLIVGAGIAGLTLSALLRQKGIKPQIVDRASDFAQAGYMLGRGARLQSRVFVDAEEDRATGVARPQQ